MQLSHLEHLIRASAAIADEYDLIIIGSASIFGTYSDVPESLAMTREADIYPLRDSHKADLIDAAIGEGSQFDITYGYYAYGVGPETAILPMGWMDRLVRLQNNRTDGKVGLCLEPHDLAASKMAAGRDKDVSFIKEMINHHLIDVDILIARLSLLPIQAEQIQILIFNFLMIANQDKRPEP